jgi:hypothetical protein
MWEEPRPRSNAEAARRTAAEVPERRHQARRRLRPDPVDRRQQPADLVLPEQPIDIALEIPQAPPQHIQILAGVPHLDAIGLPVVAPHGAGGRGDQGGGELVADFVAPIVAQGGHASDRHALKAGRGGIGRSSAVASSLSRSRT